MTKRKPKWTPLEVFQSYRGDWYWGLRARNGRIVADGAEGYSTEAKARQGFRAAARLAALALKEMER
jgi:uncharacterized protein YegP (UPF0339 family)